MLTQILLSNGLKGFLSEIELQKSVEASLSLHQHIRGNIKLFFKPVSGLLLFVL